MKSLLLLVPVLFIVGCTHPVVQPDIQKGIDSIASKWVPDIREAIADVTIGKNNEGLFVLTGETSLPGLKDDVTAYLENMKVKYTDNFNLLPDSSINDKPWGLVSISVANVKALPSYSSELVSQAIMGTPVKIFKKKGGWLLVQTPDFYVGWVNDSGLQEVNNEEIEAWKNSKRLIFTGRSGDIFSENNDGSMVSDIVAGAIVAYSGVGAGFYSIILPDGRKGRIAKEMAVDFDSWSSTVKPDAEKLIIFAKQFIGYPYLWGGTSAKAMDCSGFTKTIYFTGGIILARDASQQFLHGVKVDVSSSLSNLQPGDLVYIGRLNKEGKERITHTGMYIGNTEVIHSSGLVSINSLDSTRSNYSSYLGKGLRGARRIIGADPGKGTEPVGLNNWYKSQK